MTTKTRFPRALAVFVLGAACYGGEDPYEDCLGGVSMQGAWEGREGMDGSGTWWRFDLREVPAHGWTALGGTYVTDYLYWLERFQDPDTLRGSVAGGLSCSPRGLAAEMGLTFQLEYPDVTEYCDLTGSVWRQGLEQHVSTGLLCATDNMRRDRTLMLQRVGAP